MADAFQLMLGKPPRRPHLEGLSLDLGFRVKSKTLNRSYVGLGASVCADNGAFYALNGVPFVMGTTGGDREKLLRDVTESGNYAVIAPQMGKQVILGLNCTSKP